jgi:phosphate transport system protein
MASSDPGPAVAQSVSVSATGPEAGLVELTLKACRLARSAAAATADAIATGMPDLYEQVFRAEQELDDIDMEMDEALVFAISQSSVGQARELLACMKYVLDLERIGDLLSSFCSRASAVRERIEQADIETFIRMATVLEHMLGEAEKALATRDLRAALQVLRTDSELDRHYHLLCLRHLEEADGGASGARQESVQVLFMAQALERAGDHAKNLGEEVCHCVSGRSVRHVMRSQDRCEEQLFLDRLREKQEAPP